MGGVFLLSPQRGLTGRYYANTNWSGEPMLVRIDPQIQLSDVPPTQQNFFNQDYFSVAWEGFVDIPKEGNYIWSTRSDDGSWLYIDGKLVVNNGGNHSFQEVARALTLSKGLHSIKVLYFEGVRQAGIKWFWKPPGKEKEPVPARILFPYRPSAGSLLVRRSFPYLWVSLIGTWVGVGSYLTYVLYQKGYFTTKNLKPVPYRPALIGLFLACLSFYLSQILKNNSVSILPGDPFGYVQMAELMAEKGLFNTMLYDPLIPELYNAYQNRPEDKAFLLFFSPHMYYVHDFQKGVLYNQYPPGFPFLLSLFIRAGGRDTAFYTLPALNGLFLLFMFGYFSIKYGGLIGLLITNHFASLPLVCFLTVLPMSDIPSVAFTTSALLILYSALHQPGSWRFLVSGALFGFSITLRYTNALAAVPILYLFLVRHKNLYPEPDRRRRVLIDLALFALGGLGFGGIPLMIYQYHLHGNPFRSTYPDTEAMRIFLLENWKTGTSFYLRSLSVALDPLQKALLGGGLIAGLLNKKSRDLTIAGLLLFVAFLVFHIFPVYRHERYLLPAFPFLFILMGLAGYSLLQFSRRSRSLTAIGSLLILTLALYPLLQLRQFHGGTGWFHRMLAERVKQATEENAVIFCEDESGPLKLYADRRTYKIAWLYTDRKEDILEQTVRYLAKNRYPVYVMLDTLGSGMMFKLLEAKFSFERMNIPGLKIPMYKLKGEL